MKPVLIVDDEPAMRDALAGALRCHGYESVQAASPEYVLGRMNLDSFGLVITDMRMPQMDGLGFLREIRARTGALPVLVVTGYGTVENAVEAMKFGAADYLMKPFSVESLGRVLARLFPGRTEEDIVARSEAMEDLLARAGAAAESDITILLEGESGTGKEVLARFIHRRSRRARGPFVAVNCAAIPGTLLESELFGHERGAFTGAGERRKGKFELAEGGTILLDELSEMPPELQAKMLRVLQEREIDRVGGSSPVSVDIRIIATTNRDLADEVRRGRFREDLFYRVSVLPLSVPPLRERREDILPLAEHFLRIYGGGAGRVLGPEARRALENYPWKGNVRELENTMQRACLLASGTTLRPEDLNLRAVNDITPGSVKDMERDLILRTLDTTGGNRTRAARQLGISVRTLRNKLARYIEEGQYVPG